MASKPVDFDAVLRALGAEDAEPPPLMRKLLAELPASKSSPADAQVLAELEAWLHAILGDRARRARP